MTSRSAVTLNSIGLPFCTRDSAGTRATHWPVSAARALSCGACAGGTELLKYTYFSAPNDSTTSTVAVNVTVCAAGPAGPSAASPRCSGRTPTITSPAAFRAVSSSRVARSRLTAPNGRRTPASVSVPGKKFIAGDPMNPATNRLAGCAYSASGVSICCTRPPCITTTRSPRVIASVWSWVTYTVVVASRRCSRAISVRIATRSFASRFDRGSSIKNACG